MTRGIATLRGVLFRLGCRLFRPRVEIGPGLQVHCRLGIKGPGRVIVGRNCSVHGLPGSRIKYVTLYTHSPDAVIRIGDDAVLFAARIGCKHAITLGNGCLVEDASIFDTGFHSIDASRGKPICEGLEGCRIEIADGVSVAAGSIVTKGVAIGEGAVVGPSSVVNRSIPAGSFVLGNPARPIKR